MAFYRCWLSAVCVSFLAAAPIHVNAWIAAKPIFRPTSIHVAATAEPSIREAEKDPFEGITNLIDDGNGHIRSDLATSIWNWDHANRDRKHLKDFQFSTRAGLRLVDEVARQLLEMRDGNRAATTYSDLVQEGVVALMYSMAKYDPDLYKDTESFEHFARRNIVHSLTKAMAQESRPIRLPNQVIQLLQQARDIKSKLQSQTGTEPTMAQVAEEMGVSQKQLELYQLVSGNTLSVERTMEIYDPADTSATFEDYDKWERQHTVDETVTPKEEVEEGEDEMWVHQEQIAAPLRDMIPDNDEPTPDDLVFEEEIHQDVDDFLRTTLQDRELQVIRMRYGLDTGKGMTYSSIGKVLHVTASRAKQIESKAMEKLRFSRINQKVEPYLEDEHESFGEQGSS